MKEKDDYDFMEANEVIEGDYLDKLNEYSQILDKDQNLFIRIQDKRHHIKLLSNLSFFRICTLGEIVPEENVIFTLYNVFSDESDNEKDSNKKGIDKLKERLSESENMKNKLKDNKSIQKLETIKKKSSKNVRSSKNVLIRSSKNVLKSIKDDEKKENDSVVLLDDIKPSLLQKEEETFRNNYELYVTLWKNLYKWLLLFPLIIILGLLIYIIKDNYDFTFAEIISFLLIFIISFTSMSGNEKLLSNKKVNFKRENILLFIIVLFNTYILLCTNARIEITAYKFLNQYYYFIHITFILLIFLCLTLIYLNIKMINFYIRYSRNISRSKLID